MANNIVTFSQQIAQQLSDSAERFPVDFDLAWQWMGYARRDNALRRLKHFKEGDLFRKVEEKTAGRSIQRFWLTVDCFKSMAMMAQTEQGDKVREYFLECERIAKQIASTEKVFTLEMAVRRDPMDWEQMFMPTWIAEAERLTGWKWTWKAMSHFINATVYAYLPVDVATLLRSLRNSQDKTLKLHQFLQPEIREIVFDHLNTVEDLMRAAKGNLSLFELLMSNYFGRYKLIESDKDQLTLFEIETKYLPISAN
jgi:phage anti-repressor protein